VRLVTRYILKEHLLPFFYALLILVFLLFINFFLRAIDRFLGKGLPTGVILEYLFLNTAWILALAIPMAVLVATLMAFGRLSEDNETTAMQGSGISFATILWPALAFSIAVATPLTYFNNTVLPKMNHKARTLARDIYRKRPDLNVEAGYFIDNLPEYSFIVKGKRGNRYQGVRIYGKDRTTTQTSIHAEEGTFDALGDAILVTLYNGEIHELDVKNYQNYRRIAFERHRITIPADDLTLQRRDTASRTDREMTYSMMREKIATYHRKIMSVKERVAKQIHKEFPDVSVPDDFQQLVTVLHSYLKEIQEDTTLTQKELIGKTRRIDSLIGQIKSDSQIMEGYSRSANRYTVEMHKKFSIPVACIVFVLIGAPLGIMARRGSFVTAISLSLGFFLIYWVFLIGGEELADRNFLSPELAMWGPNLILGIVGAYLSFIASKDTNSFRLASLLKFFNKRKKP